MEEPLGPTGRDGLSGSWDPGSPGTAHGYRQDGTGVGFHETEPGGIVGGLREDGTK